jgi:hypothetical protein
MQWRFVADVEPEEGELTASFDGRSVTYGFGELRHPGAGVRRKHPQEPRLGIPSRGDPGHDAALRYAAAAVAIAVRNVSGRRRWRNWRNG